MEKDLKQVPSSCLKAVVYGPESTGKTTLAQQLAAHYQTMCTGEYAREFLQKKWDQKKEVCELSDLPHIVAGQLQWENQAVAYANRLLICDTNVLVTRVWSETHFEGYCDPKLWPVATNFNTTFIYSPVLMYPGKKTILEIAPMIENICLIILKIYWINDRKTTAS